jgi:uncharacterized protein (TIGR02996 family)
VSTKAFLSDICEHPDDDTPRLVYADWLDDNGDSDRAEFIRGQIELLRLDRDDPRFADLAARMRELEENNGKLWKRDLPRWAHLPYEDRVAALTARPRYFPSSQFHRGFATVVECDVANLLRSGEKLFARAPIQGLHIPDPTTDLEGLARLHLLARLNALDLRQTNLDDEATRTLARSPHLGNLHTLLLGLNTIGAAGIAALGKNRGLAGLRWLDLPGNRFGTLGARALARLSNLPRLERLTISHNDMGDAGLAALARSPLLDPVRKLDLGDNGLGFRGMTALAGSDHLRALTHLSLAFNAIDADGARALAGSTVLTELVDLDLRRNLLGSEGLRAIVWGRLGPLCSLDLFECGIDASGAAVLADCSRLVS